MILVTSEINQCQSDEHIFKKLYLNDKPPILNADQEQHTDVVNVKMYLQLNLIDFIQR